jgi:hypothetical protein
MIEAEDNTAERGQNPCVHVAEGVAVLGKVSEEVCLEKLSCHHTYMAEATCNPLASHHVP